MSTKANQYVCNVGSDEKPLEMPQMDFDEQAKHTYQGQGDSSSKSQEQEGPLGLPTTAISRKDGK